MQEIFAKCLEDAGRALNQFKADTHNIEVLEQMGNAIFDCFNRRGRVFSCGNGGSMADAIHFAEEWTGRFKKDRKPYPALALGEAAHLTCVGNDYGFEHVFSRQVEAFGHAGDVLLLLSTSGNSQNLSEAAKVAKSRGVAVFAMLGRDGGRLSGLCDLSLVMPGDTSDRIQELHMLCLHALIEAVEEKLGREDRAG